MPPRIGVLLVNIGTPDAPTPAAVRRYLSEFLSDRRVVEIPPLLWQPILRGIVLRTRPARSARAYRLVWDEARDVSPLRGITEDQAAALAAALPEEVVVGHAMRYGAPAIGERLAWLQAQGCDRILLAPLFPQYSGATTASAVDAAGRALAAMRRPPALRRLPAYFDAPD
jgi:ferrochelatase